MNIKPDISSLPDFQNIFETIPGMYLILFPDFSIAMVNGAFARATMTKPEDIIGRNIFEVFPESSNTSEANSKSIVTTSFERVLKDRVTDKVEQLRFDLLNPEANNNEFITKYWSLSSVPVVNKKSDQVEYIVSSIEDITEVVRLQKVEQNSEDRFFKIFNMSPEAKAISRIKDGKFLYANTANEKLTGWTPEEMIGKSSEELRIVDEDERARIRELMKAYGHLRDTEIKIRTKTGEYKYAYVNVEMIELDGE